MKNSGCITNDDGSRTFELRSGMTVASKLRACSAMLSMLCWFLPRVLRKGASPVLHAWPCFHWPRSLFKGLNIASPADYRASQEQQSAATSARSSWAKIAETMSRLLSKTQCACTRAPLGCSVLVPRSVSSSRSRSSITSSRARQQQRSSLLYVQATGVPLMLVACRPCSIMRQLTAARPPTAADRLCRHWWAST